MIPLVMSVIARTETFERNMAKSRSSVGRFESSIKKSNITLSGFTKTFLRLAGVGGGLYLFQRGLRGAINATIEQEKAENELKAAIGGNIEAYKKYAAGLQKVTIYGDEAILSQMAYARNLGVTKDKLEEATVAAIGLAAKYRLELNTAFMLIGRASQGQTQMLTRYGIVLDNTLSNQEKFDAILKIGAGAFHLARKETETAAGALAQYHNIMGDLGETLGGPLINSLTTVLKEINKNSEAWARFFKIQAEGWAEILSGFKSLGTILDELDKRAQTHGKRAGYTSGAWGFSAAEMAGINARARGITTPETLPEGKLEISPRGYQRLAEMRARIYEQQMAAQKETTAGVETLIGPEIDRTELAKRQSEIWMNSIDEKAKKVAQQMEFINNKIFEVADSIESSMSNAFQSMIMQGKSFKDAMNQFFLDIAASFAKMAADMAARAIMMNLFGGVLGGLTGQVPAFSRQPYPVHHRGWVPEGLPDFHGGRAMRSDEMVALVKKDELIAPSRQIIRQPGTLKPGDSGIEDKLDQLIKIMSQRQTINANIIDKRDVVTKERMDGREGEEWTMQHIKANS